MMGAPLPALGFLMEGVMCCLQEIDADVQRWSAGSRLLEMYGCAAYPYINVLHHLAFIFSCTD